MVIARDVVELLVQKKGADLTATDKVSELLVSCVSSPHDVPPETTPSERLHCWQPRTARTRQW